MIFTLNAFSFQCVLKAAGRQTPLHKQTMIVLHLFVHFYFNWLLLFWFQVRRKWLYRGVRQLTSVFEQVWNGVDDVNLLDCLLYDRFSILIYFFGWILLLCRRVCKKFFIEIRVNWGYCRCPPCGSRSTRSPCHCGNNSVALSEWHGDFSIRETRPHNLHR